MAGLGVPRQQANWAGQSREFLKGAGSSYAQMQREEKSTSTTEGPGKTAGGAIGAGAGLGVTGAVMGSAGMLGSLGGPAGAAIGFGIAALGYFL